MASQIADLRKDYTLNGLDRADILPNPIDQFRRWFDEALAAGVNEPNAMHLATISPDGRPEGRIVLVKGIDNRGLAFYTNYNSQKGRSLADTPVAALTFFWPELERQVRMSGRVERVSAVESDAYFNTRPRGSQLGAWASDQSHVIASRAVLEEQDQLMEDRFAGQPVPRPEHWGGFRVVPDQVEFWQGRPSRLHDRMQYRLDAGAWLIDRLSP